MSMTIVDSLSALGRAVECVRSDAGDLTDLVADLTEERDDLRARVAELEERCARQDQTLVAHRPPADSWERLWDDASGGACDYFGSHEGCGDCPANVSDYDCDAQMSRDVVRRARALAERGE